MTITLARGPHRTRDEGVDLMEAAAQAAGERHTATPDCVSGLLTSVGVQLNNALPYHQRQALVPLIPRLIGTRDDGCDEQRSYMALDFLVRTWTPVWLDLAGLAMEAAALRGLPRIVDLATAQMAGPPVRHVRDKAADAAQAADWAIAQADACTAAWEAVWAVWAVNKDAGWAAGSTGWAAGDIGGAAGDIGGAIGARLHAAPAALASSVVNLYEAMVAMECPA